MAGDRAKAPVSLQPAASLIPDGLADLGVRAEAEGIGIVARVLARWADGSERYDRPGEALLAAVAPSGEVAGIGGLTVCPSMAGAMRVRRFHVRPEQRRRGVARLLASTLLAGGFEHTSTLTCNAGASDAAAPFWESMGFEPIDHPGITHVLARP
jgi:GNAT superfamily N-acetyltransferase